MTTYKELLVLKRDPILGPGLLVGTADSFAESVRGALLLPPPNAANEDENMAVSAHELSAVGAIRWAVSTLSADAPGRLGVDTRVLLDASADSA